MKKKSLLRKKEDRSKLALCILPLLKIFLFSYCPMIGIVIAFEKFNKVAVALSGGFLSVFIGLLSDRKSEALYYINYIDFNVVFLLVGIVAVIPWLQFYFLPFNF